MAPFLCVWVGLFGGCLSVSQAQKTAMVHAIVESNWERVTEQGLAGMGPPQSMAEQDDKHQHRVVLLQTQASKTLAEAEQVLAVHGEKGLEKATIKENSDQDPGAYQASVVVKISSSSPQEIRLTSAIAKQARIVANESRVLVSLQAKINETLALQEVAQYKYDLAVQVSKRVVDAYIERENLTNAGQLTLRDIQIGSLQAQADFEGAAADAAAAKNQSRQEQNSIADASDLVSELEDIAEEAREALEKAENATEADVQYLYNRSDDLQKAIDELGRRNDELVEVQRQLNEALGISLMQSTGSSRKGEDVEPTIRDLAAQEENLTARVHDQALVVANLTDEVSRLKTVVGNDTKVQRETAQDYADAVAALDAATKDLEDTNATVSELRAREANASAVAAGATIRFQTAAATLSFGNQTFERVLLILLAMRETVQNATDAELQAQLDCSKANVTLATFSEILVEQTSRLQEEMDRLNLLNDELVHVQSSLRHQGGESGAPMPLPWNPLVLLLMAVAVVTTVKRAGA